MLYAQQLVLFSPGAVPAAKHVQLLQVRKTGLFGFCCIRAGLCIMALLVLVSPGAVPAATHVQLLQVRTSFLLCCICSCVCMAVSYGAAFCAAMLWCSAAASRALRSVSFVLCCAGRNRTSQRPRPPRRRRPL